MATKLTLQGIAASADVNGHPRLLITDKDVLYKLKQLQYSFPYTTLPFSEKDNTDEVLAIVRFKVPKTYADMFVKIHAKKQGAYVKATFIISKTSSYGDSGIGFVLQEPFE